jgi:hypothetical protein
MEQKFRVTFADVWFGFQQRNPINHPSEKNLDYQIEKDLRVHRFTHFIHAKF